MKRNKFRYNRDNITSRLFAQNRKRRPSHYDDEDEDEDEEEHRGGGMSTAGALGVGATGLALANQGLSAMGTIQGVKEQAGGIKGWWDRRKRRKADYKKFGGDEHLMEKKRDQAFRLSKNAKNSAQEAALKHRESEIADSLNYTRKKNAYKNEMATKKSWIGKGTTWAKHNPWQAGAAVAGGAALAGGAYYLWKKRQEKKRREKERREREAQTRHQSNIVSRMFAVGMRGRGLGAATARASRVLGKSKTIMPTSTIGHYQPKVKPKPHVMDMYTKPKTSTPTTHTPHTPPTHTPHTPPTPTPHTPPTPTTSANANVSHPAPSTNHNLANVKVNRNKRRLDRLKQKKQNLINDAKTGSYNAMSKDRAAEIKQRQTDKINDQARRDKAQKKAHERQISQKEQKVRDLAAKTDLQRTAGAGVMGHEYRQAQKELRNANIDLHETKYKDDTWGDLKARGLGFKKFDKNGNIRWGKKRLAAGALGAYAAYNMLKDDDEK